MFGKTKIKVSGMSCQHCERRVENALLAVGGVKSAKASAKNGTAEISCGNDAAVIEAAKNAIKDAGYGVE